MPARAAIDLMERVLPIAATAAMGVLLIIALLRYFAEPIYPNTTFTQLVRILRGGRVQVRRPYPPEKLLSGTPLLWILALFLISRALIYLIALCGAALTDQLGAFLSQPDRFFTRWDANHYIGLAKNWYVNEGDARFHIVFYPLYPLIVRAAQPLFFGNAQLAAYAMSAVCLLASGYALYNLVRIQYGADAARRAVRYLFFNPLSFFLTMPYSESLFLMLTLLAVLLARRRHMGWAIVMGALASATRLLGLLIAVPIYLEFLRVARERSGGARGRYFGRALIYALCTCAVALGFGAYLLLNYKVTGNPFQFLIYQKDHWSQEFGSLYNTLRTTIGYLFRGDIDMGFKLGVWIPQLPAILLTILLIAVTFNRAHPGDGAYALVYTYAALAPTWLLSGPRYLMAMYALYPLMTLITRRRWQDYVVMTVFLLGMAYGVHVFVIMGTMY